MNYYLKQCTASDFDTLRELSIRTFYETFAHLNTSEDMAAYLEDAFNNEKAIRFYKKNNFYEIGTHTFFVGEDVQTDYIMRKDLM